LISPTEVAGIDLHDHEQMVTYDCLKNGHTGEVYCLDSQGEFELASGSEDSTCRLWDLRSNKSVRCLRGPFGKLGVSCVKYSAVDSKRLYATSGSTFYEFDLRSTDIILQKCDRSFLCSATDEINDIGVHHNGKYVACADDSGSVKVLSLEEKGIDLFRRLKGRHENICSTAQFRPKVHWDLCSGALDSTMISWDCCTGKPKVVHQVGLYEENSKLDGGKYAATTSGSQAFNPPLVHAVSWTQDGKYIVTGLGDSTVGIYRHGEVKPVFRFPAHNAAVCQVKAFNPTSETFSEGEYRLYSAGNDSRLRVWTLNNLEKCAGSSNSEVSLKENISVPLLQKPNWISPIINGRVAVADTSNSISIFNL